MKKVIASFLSIMVALGLFAGQAGAYQYFDEPPFEAYKVSQGDSFFYIAQRYGLNYRELQRLNSNVDPYNMQVGSVIRLMEEKAEEPQQDNSFEAEVVRLVNQERTRRGIHPLENSAQIQRVAYAKSRDMVVNNYFSHTSPTYGSPFDMLRSYGVQYRTAGENIAKGQRTPQQVVNAWMNSSGHRQNILNRNYNKIGVGYYQNAWTQLFTD